MSEFDLIRRLQELICVEPGAGVAGCVVGIGDDGAVLDLPEGQSLVVCTDTLVEGVHFPDTALPGSTGHKSLAVNLSDLAAMGARPAWFFMALTLPKQDAVWLDAFAAGMADLAATARVMLSGGDVTSGPLSITITALGLIERGRALVRSGAAPGDLVVVSGRPGSAAHALEQLRRSETPADEDLSALEYPVPRLALGRSLRGLASACIDISDGLAADLGHILELSGVGAAIDLRRLPCPDSLAAFSGKDRWPLQLAGGDDYELCFTLPPRMEPELKELARSGVAELTVIGEITRDNGLLFETGDGKTYQPKRPGYRHFDESGGGMQ